MHKPAGNRIDSLLASIEGIARRPITLIAPISPLWPKPHTPIVQKRCGASGYCFSASHRREQATPQGQQTTQETPRIEEDDFDANLARLMQDITAQTPGKRRKTCLRTRASLEDFKNRKQSNAKPPIWIMLMAIFKMISALKLTACLPRIWIKALLRYRRVQLSPRRQAMIRQNHPPSGRICRYQG